MAGLANNNNPFQSQVRVGPGYIQLVPGPPGPPGTIALTGSGLVHVTSGNVDNAAYLGAAGSIPIVNSGGTDTTWLAIGSPGQVLTVVGGAPTWAAAPSGVTWANDLSTSSNTHQYVSSISGANGTSGNVNVGDGISTTRLWGTVASGASTPQVELIASYGWPGNSGVGGNLWCLSGTGGSAAAGNNTGGNGGLLLLFSGSGGSSTGTAANSAAGAIRIATGAPGTGGSGAAGAYGNITLETGAGTLAFVTSNAAGPGFGIGSTPGTDPTITRGTGVPATTQTNGSLFLRTDGTSGSNALYAREGGVWYAIGGTTTANAALTFEGQAFQLAAIGNGNGTISWPAATTVATITQAPPTSDVGVNGLLIQSQSAFAGASTFLTGSTLTLNSGAGATTNGSSGNIVLTAPAATGAGTQGQAQINAQTVVTWANNNYTVSAAASALTLANSASQTIFSIQAGGAVQGALRADSSGNLNWHCNGGYQEFYGGTTNGQPILYLSNPNIAGSANMTFNGSTTAIAGGGLGVFGIGQAGTVPTSAPAYGGIMWMNTGSPGSLGLFTTGVQFHRLAGAITISQDAPTSDVATTGTTVKAQSAYGSAATNVNGASATLAGGNSTNGTLGAAILLGGATNAGSLQGTIGTPASTTWAWTVTTVTTTTGTVTLSSSQYNSPLIRVNATLTGNLNITFPNVPGFWIVDTNSLVLSGHTFTLQSGSATFAASFGKLYTIVSYGGNTLVVSAG